MASKARLNRLKPVYVEEQAATTQEISSSMQTATIAVSEVNSGLESIGAAIENADKLAKEGSELYRSLKKNKHRVGYTFNEQEVMHLHHLFSLKVLLFADYRPASAAASRASFAASQNCSAVAR